MSTRASLAALAALVVVAFRDPLLTGRAFYERDVHLVWSAQAIAFVRSVVQAAWPLWDPYLGFGQPLLANPNAQVLYPPTWLHLFVQPWTQYALAAAAHALAGGAGLLALLRSHGRGRFAALAGAAIFVVSGPFLSLVPVWHHFSGAALLPWVYLAAERALVRGRRLDVALAGAASGLQVLAGSPDLCALTWAALGLRALAEIGPRGGLPKLLVLLRLAGAAALGAAISAAQWLPTLAVARGSERGSLAQEARAYWSLPPPALAQVALPVLYRDIPLASGGRPIGLEAQSPFLASVYLGLPTLAFALFASGARRGSGLRLYLALLVLAVLLSLGRHLPLYGLAVSALPPLAMFRYPMKAMVLAAFAWSLLCGLGLDRLWRGDAARAVARRAALAAAAGALIAVVLALAAWRGAAWLAPFVVAGPGSPGLDAALRPAALSLGVSGLAAAGAALASAVPALAGATALAVALSLLDLGFAHRELNRTTAIELYTARPPALAALGNDEARRVYAFDYLRFRVPGKRSFDVDMSPLVPAGVPPSLARAASLQQYLYPPAAGRWAVAGSFDKDLLGLYPPELTAMNVALRAAEETPAFARLLRAGGVTHVLALHDPGDPALERVAELESLFAAPIRVFRLADPLPRALVVGGVAVAGAEDALSALASGAADPRTSALLVDGPARRVAPSFSGSARVVERRPDRLRIETEASHDAHLVVLEAWDAGWAARLDGQPAPLLRANVAFRAVALPPGRHSVEMTYRPRSFSLGLAVSAAGLLALGAALAGARRGAAGGGGGDHRIERLKREQAHARVILAADERHWGWQGPAGRIRWQRRVEILRGGPGPSTARVLEIGAGTGTFTGELRSCFPRLVSLDIAPDLLKRARERAPGADLVLTDAHDPGLATGAFDRVVGCSVLHHLDWDAALAAAFRVLRPGGGLAFSEPNLANPQIFLQKNLPAIKRRLGDSPDEYAFTAATIRRSLERAGFVDIRVEAYEFLHPATPEPLIPLVLKLEELLQRTPLRAFAGSLRIEAGKPLRACDHRIDASRS